jgi:hypothetical protein
MSIAESDLASEYAQMAADSAREVEADAWADALLDDASDGVPHEFPCGTD